MLNIGNAQNVTGVENDHAKQNPVHGGVCRGIDRNYLILFCYGSRVMFVYFFKIHAAFKPDPR